MFMSVNLLFNLFIFLALYQTRVGTYSVGKHAGVKHLGSTQTVAEPG